MKFHALLFALLLATSLHAQISNNLTIYSEDGLKFTLYLNGEQKNAEPKSNVKVENTDLSYADTKVVFEDTSKGMLRNKILRIGEVGDDFLPVETVYKIITNKKGELDFKFASRSPRKIQTPAVIIQNQSAPPTNGNGIQITTPNSEIKISTP